MSYELRAHTADIAVAARGESLESTFAAVADGLAGASCDEIAAGDAAPPTPDDAAPGASTDRFSLAVTAENREALLFEYLDELIYLRDVRLELPVENRVERLAEEPETDEGDDLDAWRLEATARGVPLSDIDAREIKAVTYSEMRLEEVDAGWEAYVVFDV
ncbi:archease [Natronosalvus vescus]|uniref:archease n=1 Tax=Natronosalvus vescus TaxID=2953881 RepID=UPI00209145A9|nr:archease [Natronosalvus vescus]